ncbi:HTH-like domain-containing protein [Piscibacillus salipiscarius]|uniref:HTH-like domain-containing protein n=1 Tax=Piscibacillus salipiscarius TaxID=299480 RepID=A0ABW5QDY8_9BACI|nr:hypothetical protein [Piscibacillus salipiscarius]
MRKAELGKLLKDMYNSAPPKEQVTFIHLFGIKYGTEILRNDYNIAEIVSISGISESYKTEVRKGVNLSKYVNIMK